ncbi:MAG: aldo/keto reductase, partial [Alphaproteobacteria bacterium]|nr:aldo/keto reductase [Alphaproteobacteria bacterium]
EDRVEALRTLARQSGRRLLELAIGWLLSRPVVACVVAGASKVEQVAANVAAARVKLTQDELDALDRCTA